MDTKKIGGGHTAVSLFSGAGGMDVGFARAGFDIVLANDFDKDACETYRRNIGSHIVCGDVERVFASLPDFEKRPSLVFGGPPCQGFSVAGKMNPDDPRSRHVMNFASIVGRIRPLAFVMENVKALGELEKWRNLRESLLGKFAELGYVADFAVLNASDFGVPQSRERVFFVGFDADMFGTDPEFDVASEMVRKRVPSPVTRDVLLSLDEPGEGNNAHVCTAKVSFASKPVMRKSPYAGMLFNGLGRPLKLDGYSATLPATMGGNKTPIVDEEALRKNSANWVEEYHARLMSGESPMSGEAPSRLRRLTVREAAALQTFPSGYDFAGSRSSIYKQIGNAVPCNLAFAVASMVREKLDAALSGRVAGRLERAC